jgi:glucokinase
MSLSGEHALLGDIGATNARFALLEDGVLGPIRSFEVAKFARFADALELFLKDYGSHAPPQHALFAIAAPINDERDERCSLTNCSWLIDRQELRMRFRIESRLLNDFEAVALSLPLLSPTDLVKIGPGRPQTSAPRAVLGPGTGLGVACLITSSREPIVIPSEGGHSTLAGTSEREDFILQQIRRRFGHASAERAISGFGLENIYAAIAAIDGIELPHRSAAEITQQALKGECKLSFEALNTFCSLLGSFAGNLALTFGARGGVYIAGGISPRILNFLIQSEFRNRFESKGRFHDYLKNVPSYVITHPAAAFLGLVARLRSVEYGAQVQPLSAS